MNRRYEAIAQIGVLALLASCSSSHLGGGADGGTAGVAGPGQAGADGTGAGGSTAGPGGRGGTGGTSGSGGWSVACASGGNFGSGGDAGDGGPRNCPPPAPACGTAVCGNGQRDQCAKEMTATCLARTDLEPCDGSDLGGESCVSLHFGSGTLACGSNCALDTSGCHDCVPLGEGLVRCGEAPLPANQSWSLAVAATDTEVGIAWLGQADDATSVSFARLSPGLDQIGSQVLDSGPPNCASAWRGIAVTAVTSGWLIAVGGNPEVVVYALDPTGRQIGRMVIDRPAPYYYDYPQTPVLVARPAGGALLVWQTTTGLLASLIAADGLSAGLPINLSNAGAQVSAVVRAVCFGDAYYVYAPRGPLYERSAVRVNLDGSVVAPAEPVPHGITGFSAAATGANDFRFVYVDAADNTVFQRIAPDGRAIVNPTALGDFSVLGGYPILAAYGDDTLVLYNTQHTLSVGRLTPDGAYRAAPRDIAGLPADGNIFSAALRGPDLVVAWIDGGSRSGIDIARFTP